MTAGHMPAPTGRCMWQQAACQLLKGHDREAHVTAGHMPASTGSRGRTEKNGLFPLGELGDQNLREGPWVYCEHSCKAASAQYSPF